MRAGAYTIHQSLTAEAAAVLKLALALARRRGHAQVTPLHVAFALLTGPAAACAYPPLAAPFSSPAGAPYGLLKRACLRSHTASTTRAAAHQHPLQWRALELCFNVALNRLPTSGGPQSPPSAHFASPLIQPSPTLSNALVAALKRAQANQRRGCVELQQPPPPPPPATPQQQQQQPLLAIKVELDQLVISILDDPSVSRVMREAGFSSATVKSNLEEESALMTPPPSSSSSSPPPPPPPIPPHFFLDPSSIANGGGDKGVGCLALWPAQFLASPPASDACSDDVRAVLEVMVRKEGKRSNPVVVGDSVSVAEAVAGEVLRRLERGGDVPVELAGAHLLKLQLSYVHVRLMSRGDVEARAAELRRSVDAVVQLQRGGGGGLVVYVGDLRWALDEELHHHGTASSYRPVDHMVAELGRLLDDLRASRGRAWLVATASYHTYMRWQQRRRRPLESAWALQAVVVPTGSGTGLALNSLHSSSSVPSASAAPVPPAMATAQQLLGQSPFAMAAGEPTAFAAVGDEQDEAQLLLCTECSKNYEREASLVKAEASVEGPRCGLPAWLVPDRPPADQMPHHKEKYLIELKRKWSRLCRKLHLCVSDPCPLWSGSCFLTGSQSKPSVAGFLGLEGLMEHGTSQWSPSPLPRWGPSPLMAPGCHGAVTTLALGTHLLSDSATSDGLVPASGGDGSASPAARDLERKLRRNIPWQPGTVAAEITDAVVAGGRGKQGVWLYVKGRDQAALRRAATVIAEARCGSGDRVIWADPSRFSCAEELCSDVVSRAAEIGGGGKTAFVVVVDDVKNAPCDVVDCLVAASRRGSLKDHLSGQELGLSSSVVILTTSKLTVVGAGDVIGLRIWTEDEAWSEGLKRRTESSPRSECKRARHDALDLNLNLSVEEDIDNDEEDDDDDEAVPSDITHERDSGDSSENGDPDGLLESIAARVVTLDEEDGGLDVGIRARLAEAMTGHGTARVDEAVVQVLAAASGQFLEEVFERWATEVLGPAAATVRDGGKEEMVLRLTGVGGALETAGFMGSVLPSRVHMD